MAKLHGNVGDWYLSANGSGGYRIYIGGGSGILGLSNYFYTTQGAGVAPATTRGLHQLCKAGRRQWNDHRELISGREWIVDADLKDCFGSVIMRNSSRWCPTRAALGSTHNAQWSAATKFGRTCASLKQNSAPLKGGLGRWDTPPIDRRKVSLALVQTGLSNEVGWALPK
jgi:hypothetical protein